MPSISKTKSGERFRAPTDQVRKMERKKENKRNKRDRQQIRQTMAKYCNLDDTTSKLLLLERQVLGLDPQPFHIDVLKKKQKVLTELINKRRLALQQAKDEDELKKFNDKLQAYHADCRKLAVLAEQARLAREAVPEFIPLPSGDAGSSYSHILPPPQMIKKTVDFQVPSKPAKGGNKPPGPPCGVAPDFSDSEGEEDYGMDHRMAEDDLGPVPIPEFEHRVYPSQSIYRNPGPSYAAMPPPPRMPHYPPHHPAAHMQYNPMGFQHHEDAVISSAPQINRGGDGGPPAPAILSAAPELRNLRRETVKLVPAQLIRRNDGTKTKTRPVVPKKRPEQQQQAKSTDDAYNDFMKELDGLI